MRRGSNEETTGRRIRQGASTAAEKHPLRALPSFVRTGMLVAPCRRA